MNGIARGIGLTTLGAALLAGLVFASAVTAQGVGRRSATVMATVDLSSIFASLDQRSHAEATLNTLAIETKDEEERRQAEINALNDGLVDITDPVQRRLVENERDLKLFERAAWLNITMNEIDIEKALLWEDLFREVKQAIVDLALQSGIDVVISSDAGRQLMIDPEMQVAREMQVRQQIQTRRFFYASTNVDITEDVINRMNNAFNAATP